MLCYTSAGSLNKSRPVNTQSTYSKTEWESGLRRGAPQLRWRLTVCQSKKLKAASRQPYCAFDVMSESNIIRLGSIIAPLGLNNTIHYCAKGNVNFKSKAFKLNKLETVLSSIDIIFECRVSVPHCPSEPRTKHVNEIHMWAKAQESALINRGQCAPKPNLKSVANLIWQPARKRERVQSNEICRVNALWECFESEVMLVLLWQQREYLGSRNACFDSQVLHLQFNLSKLLQQRPGSH